MDNTWFIYYLFFDAYNIISSVEKTETICSKKNYEKRQNKQ